MQDHLKRHLLSVLLTALAYNANATLAFLGQRNLVDEFFSQLLQDKMKQDASWTTVSTSYDPLELYRLIERVVLKQTEDQYPFAAVHEQSLAVLNTKQGGLSNT